MLRHCFHWESFVPYFSPNSAIQPATLESSEVSEIDAVLCLDTRAKKIIFHFLEWHWNPKLAVFAFTRLCPCATTGLNGLMTCDLYFFKATQHTSANISFCFFKYIFLKFKLFHFMYNVNGLNVINNFILHKKRNIISDRFLYNYNFFNATINLN